MVLKLILVTISISLTYKGSLNLNSIPKFALLLKGFVNGLHNGKGVLLIRES